MKKLTALILTVLLVLPLSACSYIRSKLNPPIEHAGEVITAPPRDDGSEPTATGSDSELETEPAEPSPADRYDGSLGSAGTLDGRTVVLSVFANDAYTQWTDSDEDNEMKDMMLDYLNTACAWITERCAEYGASSEFVCDWKENEGLKHGVVFSTQNMIVDDSSIYSIVSRSIAQNVDVDALREKYDAEDVIFLFFYNTDDANRMRPVSLTHLNNTAFGIEFSTIPVRTSGSVTSPSTLAHELLHFFGAYDLYDTGDEMVMPREYLDHLDEIDSEDIMRSVEIGDEITRTFSAIDAYYTGIIDECGEIAEWSLPEAERFLDK